MDLSKVEINLSTKVGEKFRTSGTINKPANSISITTSFNLETPYLCKHNASLRGKKQLVKISDAGAKTNCFLSYLNDLLYFQSTEIVKVTEIPQLSP